MTNDLPAHESKADQALLTLLFEKYPVTLPPAVIFVPMSLPVDSDADPSHN